MKGCRAFDLNVVDNIEIFLSGSDLTRAVLIFYYHFAGKFQTFRGAGLVVRARVLHRLPAR